LSWSVRRLDADDAIAYRDIRLQALREHPDAFASSYESASRQPESYFGDVLGKLAFFGALGPDGTMLGVVAFSQCDGDKEKHRGWLVQMYVRPEMRGTGCALALIEALVEHARRHVIQLHLGVASHNEAALRLYRRAGFEGYGTDPRFLCVNGRYIDEHLMVRFLDEGARKEQTNE
jgi:RimJ/RimL family protein N-acetyltransferase